MKKLKYTEEMRKQDSLWEDAEEDVEIMKSLYEEIIIEARRKGFNGVAELYFIGDEAIADIYRSEKEYEKIQEKELETTCFGYCKPLIKYLEELLSEKIEVISEDDMNKLIRKAGYNNYFLEDEEDPESFIYDFTTTMDIAIDLDFGIKFDKKTKEVSFLGNRNTII